MSTRIEVTRDDGGRLRCDFAPGALAPRLIHRDQHTVRVGLVATMALLLAGDDVVIDVHVGPGVALEIIEIGGTVAYDMQGGSASWRVTATVERHSALVWSGLPLVVSGGALVARGTELHLDSRRPGIAPGDVRPGSRRGMRGGPQVDHERPARRDPGTARGPRPDRRAARGLRCLGVVPLPGHHDHARQPPRGRSWCSPARRRGQHRPVDDSRAAPVEPPPWIPTSGGGDTPANRPLRGLLSRASA